MFLHFTHTISHKLTQQAKKKQAREVSYTRFNAHKVKLEKNLLNQNRPTMSTTSRYTKIAGSRDRLKSTKNKWKWPKAKTSRKQANKYNENKGG